MRVGPVLIGQVVVELLVEMMYWEKATIPIIK